MFTLSSPLSSLYGVGGQKQKALKKLGLEKIRDLIFYFPFRYNDFSKIVAIRNLQPDKTVTVLAKIQKIQTIRTPRKKMFLTEIEVADKTGVLSCVFFNQPYITEVLKKDALVYLSGQAKYGLPYYVMQNPEYEIYKPRTIHTARIVPVYNVTYSISPKWLRYLVSLIMPLVKKMPDYLPNSIKQKYYFPSLAEALTEIHFPSSLSKMEKAKRRLAFDEFFILQTAALAHKKNLASKKAPSIPLNVKLAQSFVRSLPFHLTDDQRKCAYEILKDLEKTQPMNRLLNGDVGSGKTVVAAMALLQTAAAGWNAVLMAPTEILAEQHFQEISRLLKKFKIKVGLLTRTKKIKIKAQILIGTHALIQKKVRLKNLGLVVVDEQHRFGVKQRGELQHKITSLTPHFLSMTATPIPRSLSLTLYGDLDISLIREMPKGRKKVITKIVPPEKRKFAYEFIRKKIKTRAQAFVICPLISESDKLGVRAATEEYQKLQTSIFPEFKIGLLHGKLKTEEKDKVMADFKAGRIKILVATAVVEVGIDVPNATIMMIEGAERFGLASLHQFRGRVGRSEKQAYTFVFTESNHPNTLKRLKALISARDGFELAEYDLQFRGPGEIYGTRQAGYLDLKIGSLWDLDLIKTAREEAKQFLEKNPDLRQYPALKEKITKKLSTISLA